MKVLGIDPGTLVTGYACVHLVSGKLRACDMGIIRPPPSARLGHRYHIIFEGILSLISTFQPTHIAIETPFVHKNPQSAIKLGGAMGTILVAAAACSVEAYGYSPLEVRAGVVGRGSATKDEVQEYLARFLNFEAGSIAKLDATDALAVAVHHVQAFGAPQRIVKDVRKMRLGSVSNQEHPNLM